MARGAKTANGLTVKQNKFVNEYLKCGNASDAYRTAYNAKGMKAATVNRKAHDLLTDGKIAARLAAHQEALQERTQVSLESLTRELERDRESARAAGQFGVAVAASKAIGDLHGLQVEPRKNDRRPFADLSEEEILDRINRNNQRMEELGYTLQ